MWEIFAAWDASDFLHKGILFNSDPESWNIWSSNPKTWTCWGFPREGGFACYNLFQELCFLFWRPAFLPFPHSLPHPVQDDFHSHPYNHLQLREWKGRERLFSHHSCSPRQAGEPSEVLDTVGVYCALCVRRPRLALRVLGLLPFGSHQLLISK